jgi:hypothetical protein
LDKRSDVPESIRAQNEVLRQNDTKSTHRHATLAIICKPLHLCYFLVND